MLKTNEIVLMNWDKINWNCALSCHISFVQVDKADGHE